MESRDQKIFRFICDRNMVAADDIIQKFDISKRQLDYSVLLINNFLEISHMPQIKKQDNNYYSTLNSKNYVKVIRSLVNDIIPKEDRCYLIIMKILIRSEELRLNHFSIDLKVSRNTALTYVNKTRKILKKYGLLISFSRRNGYAIEGVEWDKRIILYKCLMHFYRRYGDIALIGMFNNEILQYMKIVKNIVDKVESFLNFKYVDEDRALLVSYLSCILYRVNCGSSVSEGQMNDKQEIKSTNVYQALFYLSNEIDILSYLSDPERLFLALQFLCMSVRDKNDTQSVEVPLLENSLWKFLTEFETNTFLILNDKEKLLKKLINHFKPAYYRIKYHIPVENVLYKKIKNEYRILHKFVQKSIGPLEEFFKTKIPDEEIAFITIFIGGHLINNGENENIEGKVIKAVILCPNGVSVSRIIEKDLKELFPEFLFYPPISTREYKNFSLAHNLVFSTVPVETKKAAFVINEIPDESEQFSLRQQVLKSMYHLNFSNIDVDELIDILKRHTANIDDEKQLKNELQTLLLGKRSNDKARNHNDQPHLLDLLKEDQIKIIDHQISWKEALVQSSNLLETKGIISAEFQNGLTDQYLSQPLYIFLKQRLLLLHLNPKQYKQRLGVSMLISKKGILYQGTVAHLIMLMSTPNSTEHLNTLYEIQELANNDTKINRIIKSKTNHDILTVLKSKRKEEKNEN